MKTDPQLERMLAFEDIDGLLRALRQPDDPLYRARAADALARTHDLAVSEWLIQSFLRDPDPSVRAASRRALDDLLGAQAGLAIQTEHSAGVADSAWLLPPEGQTGQEPTGEYDASDEQAEPADPPDWGLTATEHDTMHGLIGVLHSNSNRELRLQAVRALATYADLTATHALARLALSDYDPQVKAEAMRVLEETFQESLEDILASLRDEESVEEEDYEDEEEELEESPYDRAPSFAEQMPSVIHEERAPVWPWLLLAVFLLGAAWFFFLYPG